MRSIEKIMNCIGRKAIHTLFLASFLLCKPCAGYFFTKGKDFSCPICKIIKGVQLSEHYSIQLSYYLINDLALSPTVRKTPFNSTNIHNSAQPKTGSWHSEISQVWCENELDYIFYSTAKFAEKKSNTRFYILFHQLKIGELINSSNLSSSST